MSLSKIHEKTIIEKINQDINSMLLEFENRINNDNIKNDIILSIMELLNSHHIPSTDIDVTVTEDPDNSRNMIVDVKYNQFPTYIIDDLII